MRPILSLFRIFYTLCFSRLCTTTSCIRPGVTLLHKVSSMVATHLLCVSSNMFFPHKYAFPLQSLLLSWKIQKLSYFIVNYPRCRTSPGNSYGAALRHLPLHHQFPLNHPVPSSAQSQTSLPRAPPNISQSTQSNSTSPHPSSTALTTHSRLILGPSLLILVGSPENPIHLTVPICLMQYHSPTLPSLLTPHEATGELYLLLPNDDPSAVTQLVHWMYTNNLDIPLHSDASLNPHQEQQQACTLLCRIWLTSHHPNITAIQPLILRKLNHTITCSHLSLSVTPILPATVVEVYNDSGVTSKLWKF